MSTHNRVLIFFKVFFINQTLLMRTLSFFLVHGKTLVIIPNYFRKYSSISGFLSSYKHEIMVLTYELSGLCIKDY